MKKICNNCKYEWESRKESPKMCPACKSRDWDNPERREMTKHECGKCAHEWVSRVENPKVCPSCGTRYYRGQKYAPPITCKKCFHTWRPKKTTGSPKMCPVCKSRNYA